MHFFKQSNPFLRRRILIVEDEPDNRNYLANMLQEDYDLSFAENGKDALRLLAEDSAFSLILLDLQMPTMGGVQFMNAFSASSQLTNIPVIVMAEESDFEIKSVQKWTSDFITKPFRMPEAILARCARIIELFENKALISNTEKDPISGLYTHDYFFEYLHQIEFLDRGTDRDAVVFNIEHFHLINEIYGRSLGDEILVRLGQCLQSMLASLNAIACRAGADVFYIYCVHQDDYKEILKTLQDTLSPFTSIRNIRIRMGVWQLVDRSLEPEAWFDRANNACERISGNFTTTLTYYNKELHGKHLYEEQLIRDIQEAIDKKHLAIYYQPKYDVSGQRPRLKSAEALIRWIHPTLGFINPGDFIPLFESNGLIQKVDHYVWNEAASQLRKWKDEFGLTVPVSVNVSRIDIYDPELEDRFCNILDRYKLTTDEYFLEITESAYSENADRLIAVLEELRKKGFHIEMDDFGSGYSSLSMLTALPIDILKIDMTFVRNMEKSAKNRKLVELIVDIAKFLKVPAVAEGVETKSQLEALKEMGCHVIQGFYFSKPVPSQDFATFIEAEVKMRGSQD